MSLEDNKNIRDVKVTTNETSTQKLKVKVCGITTLREVQELVKLPIDYLGFIFAEKSKRYINSENAKKLVDYVKENSNIETVGVFLNPKYGEIESILNEVKLDIVQIHGNGILSCFTENRLNNIKADSNTLENNSHKVWRAVNGMEDDINFERLSKKYDGILLDSGNGGTGVPFDWNKYKGIGEKYNIILAGGINKDNVNSACDIIKPRVIDVNSGVEDKVTGKKDIQKVKEFLGGLNNGR